MTLPKITFHQGAYNTDPKYYHPVTNEQLSLNSLTLEELLELLSRDIISNRRLHRESLSSLRRELTINTSSIPHLASQWNSSHHGWKLVKLLHQQGLRFTKELPLVKLMTLQVKLEDTAESVGRNPLYQKIKLAWLPTWDALFTNGKRNLLSLQGFLKDYLSCEDYAPVAKAVLTEILGLITFERENLKFMRGDHPDAPQTFTRVYTQYSQATNQAYPSVNGSCMRGSFSSLDRHPVTAYCTPDVGLVWCEDADGRTTVRALVNLVHGTLCRVYGSWEPSKAGRYSEGFITAVKQHLGYERNESQGLLDCRLAMLEDTRYNGQPCYTMPYLDGAYYLYPDPSGDQWWHVTNNSVRAEVTAASQSGVITIRLVKCTDCGVTHVSSVMRGTRCFTCNEEYIRATTPFRCYFCRSAIQAGESYISEASHRHYCSIRCAEATGTRAVTYRGNTLTLSREEATNETSAT